MSFIKQMKVSVFILELSSVVFFALKGIVLERREYKPLRLGTCSKGVDELHIIIIQRKIYQAFSFKVMGWNHSWLQGRDCLNYTMRTIQFPKEVEGIGSSKDFSL